MNHYPKMTALARTFPTLEEAPIEPFAPEVLDAWACGPIPSHGGLYAARFILAVWSGYAYRGGSIPRQAPNEWPWLYTVQSPWHCGIFDVVDALGTWDATHRAAFVAWAQEPWWP